MFRAKVLALRLRRAALDARAGPRRLATQEIGRFGAVIAESRTALRGDAAVAERGLQLGKIENLRIACRALHGTVIPAGRVFSVWRQLGPPVAWRGYVPGRMLLQGCMVPAIGGGLCQLSNALYDVALTAGCRIVERHAHSRIVPGSAAAAGRDATIAWNYVDLRFAPALDVQVFARLDADWLIIRLLGRDAAPVLPAAGLAAAAALKAARDCHACGEDHCFRHRPALPAASRDSQAFLVDENWPELRAYVQAARGPEDRLGLPINGARLGLARYAWPSSGRVTTAPLAGLMRAAALRWAGGQAAARRAAELAGSERIGRSLARVLTPEIGAVTVAQSYLPFLHRIGALGGRDVTVLMTRLPMAALQARLDAAALAHPERASLADFRAPDWLVAAEEEALAAAARIVTPHAGIAALFPGRAVRLDWQLPEGFGRDRVPGRRVVFPGPVIARKGAFAVREAAIALGLEVVILGAALEGPDFWAPARVAAWRGWDGVAAVVQPALVEDQPRRLLAALAAGVPVIASPACGLEAQPGLVLVPADDAAALVAALRAVLRAAPD